MVKRTKAKFSQAHDTDQRKAHRTSNPVLFDAEVSAMALVHHNFHWDRRITNRL